MPKWTPEQKRALELRNTNLLVSAAAGSGKTTVMVQRILQLATEGNTSIDRMLVVTFTRAAALSMKQKLSAALDKMISENPASSVLRQQQKALMFADITTYDSFCVSLLRRYYFLLDLSPDFVVLDDCKNEILIKKALTEAIEEAAQKEMEGNGDHLAKLTALLCKGKKDTELENAILTVYSFSRIFPDPDRALERCLEMYSAPQGQNPWEESELLFINGEVLGAMEYLEEMERLVSGMDPFCAEAYRGICEFNKDLIATIYQAGLKRLSECLPTRFPAVPSAKKRCDDETHEEFARLYTSFKDILKGAGKRSAFLNNPFIYEDLEYIKGCFETLLNLVRDFGQRLLSLKLKDNSLHFDDISHLTIRLLQNPEVCAELRGQYDYIFVDEYQDSNKIQEYIISSIAREDNLFFVGDVKQSIYRFRQADPTLFIEKLHTYSHGMGSIVHLNNNFRSHGDILDAVNLIFSKVMKEEILELEYDADAMLYPAPDSWQTRANKEECTCEDSSCMGKGISAVELLVLKQEKEEDEETEEDTDVAELAKEELEACMLANRIKALLKEPFYDPELKTCRLPKYKDIVVLLRAANRWAGVYQKVFALLGVPLYIQPPGGFLDTFEVSLVLDFLSLLCNRSQDEKLLSVMYSALYGFSSEELGKIRANCKSGSFYQACEKYMEEEDELAKKLKDFFASLDRWKFLSANLPLDDLVWRIYEETGYIYYISALPMGESRYENLQLLCKRAWEYANKEGQSLAGFLSYVNAILNAGAALGEAVTLGENDNVVRLMSIHKSKGLEFPICIVGQCGKSFMSKPGRGAITQHQDLGLGLPFRRLLPEGTYEARESLAQLAIKNRQNQDDRAEELRLLYVAMTRGISRLILSGAVKETENMKVPRLNNYSLAKANSYFDWILPVLLEHKDGGALRLLYSYASEIPFKEGRWKVEVIPSSSLQRMQVDQKSDLARIAELLDNPPPLQQELLEKYSWSYPYASAVKLKTKQAVTELAGKKQTVLLKRPLFLQQQATLLPTEKGNAYHLIMEKLDFAKTSREEIIAQIKDLLSKGVLTEAEAKVIEPSHIAAFFASPIGARLRKSNAVFRETPFTLRIKPDGQEEYVFVQGIIDCYFQEDDALVLVDYKTDKADTDIIRERYRAQLALYKQALEKITKRRVKETALYLFENNETLYYDF